MRNPHRLTLDHIPYQRGKKSPCDRHGCPTHARWRITTPPTAQQNPTDSITPLTLCWQHAIDWLATQLPLTHNQPKIER